MPGTIIDNSIDKFDHLRGRESLGIAKGQRGGRRIYFFIGENLLCFSLPVYIYIFESFPSHCAIWKPFQFKIVTHSSTFH